jgi:hypothetical protein
MREETRRRAEMKAVAVSEMVFNALRHEMQLAADAELVELAKRLQVPNFPQPRHAPLGFQPPVSKQKLSKVVLKSMR